jgi:hypothetical protein
VINTVTKTVADAVMPIFAMPGIFSILVCFAWPFNKSAVCCW